MRNSSPNWRAKVFLVTAREVSGGVRVRGVTVGRVFQRLRGTGSTTGVSRLSQKCALRKTSARSGRIHIWPDAPSSQKAGLAEEKRCVCTVGRHTCVRMERLRLAWVGPGKGRRDAGMRGCMLACIGPAKHRTESSFPPSARLTERDVVHEITEEENRAGAGRRCERGLRSEAG